MAEAPDFAGFQRALVKGVGGWGGPKAQQWIGFTGNYKTAEIEKLRQWRTYERFPDECGDDALPLVASTFDLARLDGEATAALRARITNSWDSIHELAGSRSSVDTMLLALGATAVSFIERWEDPGEDQVNYSHLKILVDFPSFAPTLLGGGTILGGGTKLGGSIPRIKLREAARIIHKYRSAHCLPVELHLRDASPPTATLIIPLKRLLGQIKLGRQKLGAFEEF